MDTAYPDNHSDAIAQMASFIGAPGSTGAHQEDIYVASSLTISESLREIPKGQRQDACKRLYICRGNWGPLWGRNPSKADHRISKAQIFARRKTIVVTITAAKINKSLFATKIFWQKIESAFYIFFHCCQVKVLRGGGWLKAARARVAL